MPILSRRSSLPRSALMRVIASRIRSAAASARSGVENVAITASPIVLTTAPASEATISCNAPKCWPHEIVSDQIAYALVECRRALEIGKQESEACNLESLIGIECVGVIEIAKCLVGQEPFRGKERPPLAEKMMKRIAGDPQRGKHAPVGVVLN